MLKQKDIIQVFPSMRKNNRTVRVLKTPKTESSIRKVYIPSSVALLLAELREEQKETIEALGDMYENYNLVMATSYGLPLGESYLRDKMQEVIDREGLPDVVFHSLRHTSVTYKLKLSGGDIKAVQGDSGHAQADRKRFFSFQYIQHETVLSLLSNFPDGVWKIIMVSLL